MSPKPSSSPYPGCHNNETATNKSKPQHGYVACLLACDNLFSRLYNRKSDQQIQNRNGRKEKKKTEQETKACKIFAEIFRFGSFSFFRSTETGSFFLRNTNLHSTQSLFLQASPTTTAATRSFCFQRLLF